MWRPLLIEASGINTNRRFINNLSRLLISLNYLPKMIVIFELVSWLDMKTEYKRTFHIRPPIIKEARKLGHIQDRRFLDKKVETYWRCEVCKVDFQFCI